MESPSTCNRSGRSATHPQKSTGARNARPFVVRAIYWGGKEPRGRWSGEAWGSSGNWPQRRRRHAAENNAVVGRWTGGEGFVCRPRLLFGMGFLRR
ncbi:hypothetical protein JTE90_014471 [Oedothorax gibbosus]|uniref:Uncharacterized protein n=1 Tax=Oedothorax gibbosus TaxID=931172 RepID=A0AAV6VJS1_9ARAC|nr:hypothetical protein JTE90_014471 [Oedothorax gibbosus]